jgi:tellurium resistance protein TerD
MLEALVAACAIISYADSRSSLIERWKLIEVLSGDPLLAALPRSIIAEEWAAHRKAFAVDPVAARAQALRIVARLAPEPNKCRIVLEACIRIMTADRQKSSSELRELHDIREALQL